MIDARGVRRRGPLDLVAGRRGEGGERGGGGREDYDLDGKISPDLAEPRSPYWSRTGSSCRVQ